MFTAFESKLTNTIEELTFTSKTNSQIFVIINTSEVA